MSLDFCIRNNHEEVIISVPIDIDSFNEITKKSETRSGSSIITEKLTGYFQDAEFFTDELPKLKSELEYLQQDFVDNEKTFEVIYLLIQLCDIAIHLRKTIDAFAD